MILSLDSQFSSQCKMAASDEVLKETLVDVMATFKLT